MLTGLVLGTRLAAGLLALPGLAATPASSGPAIAVQSIRSAEQSQLGAISAPAAWPVTRGRGVTVAVLDTGVDASVPDLAGSVTTGPDETPGVDPRGYHPPHLHGTYIASLIAGHGSGAGRRSGVIGIAPAARILSVRVILDETEPGFSEFADESGNDDAIGTGIRYGVQHGAGVINMSLGSTAPTQNLRAALAYAATRGVVVVAAAGNDGAAQTGYTPFSYPAAFPGVIAVAAVSAHGERAAFSDDNSSVVLSAPGVNVVGAGPGGSYLEADGTSPASAFVAGVAALIRARYPKLTPFQIEQAMVSSATRRPHGGYSTGTGFGEVDAPAALTAAGHLAAARAEPGLAASAQFAHPGPIQVVHRDGARITVYSVAAVVLALAFLALLMVLAVRIRRLQGRPSVPGPGSEQLAEPQ
ncbi:MAG TPA: S8 family serine peptidase [Streptosporangiaceae bacterium]|nr:S8 family serine peptidase [Streptosporangiaceae bacterium]